MQQGRRARGGFAAVLAPCTENTAAVNDENPPSKGYFAYHIAGSDSQRTASAVTIAIFSTTAARSGFDQMVAMVLGQARKDAMWTESENRSARSHAANTITRRTVPANVSFPKPSLIAISQGLTMSGTFRFQIFDELAGSALRRFVAEY